MYTPFRLKPRIFPAVVSATVVASEAITRLRPPPPVADFVFEGGSDMDCDSAVARKITELANPAPKVAMRLMKERRSLKAGFDSRFGSFLKVVPAYVSDCPTVLSAIRLRRPSQSPSSFKFSITEIVCLSIKILDIHY
jgi:hypothetical protein